MKKLRRLINVLSANDIEAIQSSFYRESDKVAILFNKLIEEQSTDEIKSSLNLSGNAFTTLGSRLNQKIQNHLVEISESPKDDVLRKLQKIDDILFVEQPQRALATLKKLEYELKRYDLSNELTVVYKYLKRFYLNKPEYFTYSKLYNQHVAYSLALDKAEDILGNYFKEYGYFYVMKDEKRAIMLNGLFEEMLNVCALYKSHRMQVYQAAMEIVHRLNVDATVFRTYDSRPIEDVIKSVEEIFDKYHRDSIYKHLGLIFTVFKFEYYFKHGVIDKAEEMLEDIKPSIPQLLVHYENFGFPAQILNALMLIGTWNQQYYELREEIDVDYISDPSIIMIFVYQGVTAYYEQLYTDAAKLLFELSNRVSFKDYPELFAEVKCLITLVKYKQQDHALFIQNYSSAQRLLRRLDKTEVPGLAAMVKFLGILAGKNEINRKGRLEKQLAILENISFSGYSPISYLLPALKEIVESTKQA